MGNGRLRDGGLERWSDGARKAGANIGYFGFEEVEISGAFFGCGVTAFGGLWFQEVVNGGEECFRVARAIVDDVGVEL